MTNKHFNLKENPFLENTLLADIQKDHRMKKGLDKIIDFLQKGPIALLLARTGLGKSTLIRLLLKELENSQEYEPHYLHLAAMNSNALLRSMVTLLGEKPRMGKDRLFHQIFHKAKNQRGIIVFIIDEAHHLSTESLLDLRLLTASVDEGQRIQIILSGQPLLRDNIKRESLRDFRERVSMHYEIPPFDEIETFEYVRKRISQQGGDESLFSDSCLKRIHHHSGGVPRVINNLAAGCLIQAATENKKVIDEDIFITIKEEALL